MSTILVWCGAVNHDGGRFGAMSDDEIRWLDATETQAWRGFLDRPTAAGAEARAGFEAFVERDLHDRSWRWD